MYAKVKAKELMTNEVYIQSNFNKDKGTVLTGRVTYLGKNGNKYIFEDLKGITHALTDTDLEANSMLTETKVVKKGAEKLEQDKEYNHDTRALIRQAHAYKYGRKPNGRSIYGYKKEENEEVIGYLANVQGQDCLLLIGRRPNGKPDYNKYDYGMFFEKGLELEQLDVGTKYYVDNKPYRCVNVDNYNAEFESIKGEKRYERVSKNHLDVYHNIQKAPREKGILELKRPIEYKDYDKEVLMNELRLKDYEDKQAREQEKASLSGYLWGINEKNKRTGAESPYAYIDGKSNPNRVTNKKLKEGETYFTPFGHTVYRTNYGKRLMPRNGIGYLDRTYKVVKTGDYISAKRFYEEGLFVYEFGKSSVLYFTKYELSNGLVLKPLKKGAKYITPDGVLEYIGETGKGFDETVKNMTNEVMRGASQTTDIKKLMDDITVKKVDGKDKVISYNKVEARLLALPYYFRKVVAKEMETPRFAFGEKVYTALDIIQGRVYECADEKIYKPLLEEAETKIMNERISKIIKTEDEEPKEKERKGISTKITYKTIIEGKEYVTANGPAIYEGKQRDGNRMYYYFKSKNTGQRFRYSLKEMTEGYVQYMFGENEPCYLLNKRYTYQGVQGDKYCFMKNDGTDKKYCSFNAFRNGTVRKAGK